MFYILYYKVHFVSISDAFLAKKQQPIIPSGISSGFFLSSKALGKKTTPSLYVRPNRDRSKKGPRC